MAVPALDDCKPGFLPTEYNVVIAPEVLEEKKIGSIIITDATAEAEESRTMKGRLLAVSPLAFNYDQNWPDGAQPQPGQSVLFAKFGGVVVKGEDGREYRVCKDKDVMGIYQEQANV